MKNFNITGRCIPGKHYMVCIDDKLSAIAAMVEKGNYFVINRARQYGKTTTLHSLAEYLKNDYVVVSLDFQKMSTAQFRDEMTFCKAFVKLFLRTVENRRNRVDGFDSVVLDELREQTEIGNVADLGELFMHISDLCDTAEKPVVLMIDEVDSASNNQVFFDFLAQLRGYYLTREDTPIFQSVILAGVYDIKNLKLKIRPESEHKFNSPWNIAEPFGVDMSFSADGIAGMLREYEEEHHTGMKVSQVAKCIYDYTSGYPYLVSLICKILDENISEESEWLNRVGIWSENGIREAVKYIQKEQTTLFDSLIKQIDLHKELESVLYAILFQGAKLTYNPYNEAINLALMFGYVKNTNGGITISNRIFEMQLYNYFLSKEELTSISYREAQKDKNQFIKDGKLDMDKILEKFVIHFSDVYGANDQKFVEDYGRKFFLLYLKPIINGTGNYYVEAETRDSKRTDVIVDYLGEQFIVELKIWNGEKYNSEGEEQLAGYLDRYHQNKGYLLSFCFNKNKKVGVKTVQCGDKTIIEAIV